MKEIEIQGKRIGPHHPPFVIAEVGINHEGEYEKAIRLVDAAVEAGAECIKFQCHITEQEMIPTDMTPGDISKEKLWDIIKRCELSEKEEIDVKKHCDDKGIIYLSTPFSREAADRLEGMGVPAYKIGSGECNNLPLVEHIAKKKRPMILSTGMNDIASISKSVEVIKRYRVPFMLMHCVSMYPAPYEKLNLRSIPQMEELFGVPVGMSDHSLGIYTCLGAVALGASALEKHFTISRDWPGPDIPLSIEPGELSELVKGSKAVWLARGGEKAVLPEEKPVIDFAYACVVAIRDIRPEEEFSLDNIWVKRPGTGDIKAGSFNDILGKKARSRIKKDSQLKWEDIYE